MMIYINYILASAINFKGINNVEKKLQLKKKVVFSNPLIQQRGTSSRNGINGNTTQ